MSRISAGAVSRTETVIAWPLHEGEHEHEHEQTEGYSTIKDSLERHPAHARNSDAPASCPIIPLPFSLPAAALSTPRPSVPRLVDTALHDSCYPVLSLTAHVVCAEIDDVHLVRGEHLSPYQRLLEGRYFLTNGLGVTGLRHAGFLCGSDARSVLERWKTIVTLLLSDLPSDHRARALHRYVGQLLRHQGWPDLPPRRRAGGQAGRTMGHGPAAPQPHHSTPLATAVQDVVYRALSLDDVCQVLAVTPACVRHLLAQHFLALQAIVLIGARQRYTFANVRFWYFVLTGRDLANTSYAHAIVSPPQVSGQAVIEESMPDDARDGNRAHTRPVEHTRPATPLARSALPGAFHALVHAVMEYYSVSEYSILRKGRDPFMVEARAVMITIMYEDWGLGATAIGRWLDRDHSTILHHLQKNHEALGEEFAGSLSEIRALLAQHLPTTPPSLSSPPAHDG